MPCMGPSYATEEQKRNITNAVLELINKMGIGTQILGVKNWATDMDDYLKNRLYNLIADMERSSSSNGY